MTELYYHYMSRVTPEEKQGRRSRRETKLYRCFLYLQLQGKDRREAESRVWCSSAHACPEGRERQNLTASGQHAEPGELHTAR